MEFYDEWMKLEKYWFNSNNELDEYLTSKYENLLFDNDPIIQIIIYDQLSRHIYRKEYSSHIISYFNQKALKIANENKDLIEKLSYNDWMFFMLVYRHSNIRENLFFAMEEAWKRLPQSKKFIKATYNRANFEEELTKYEPNDYNRYRIFDENILENNPEKELSAIKYNIGEFDILKDKNEIIISLSGGVDSNSCLLYIKKMFPKKNIKAIHINYNNRKETKEEVNFLICLCNKLNVELYVRTINEIKRKPCIENDLRDIYESYTKKVRFNCYKKIGGDSPIIILGHNKDDCFENILTNISYKNKYDNLIGLDLISNIEGIEFIRPLYNTTKNDIYKFAKYHNLPYLKNSTPEWCQRGKIRNMVLPVLEKWDKRIIEGLFDVSTIMKDLHMNLKMNVKNETNEEKEDINTSLLFWKYLIFEKYKIYPSNKSLKSLIERLIIFKNKFPKIDINKKEKIIIKNNISMNIWKTKSLRISYEFIINKQT
jgi:tRNA(Ile)-lysidine synthetase-like protein